MPGKGTFWLKVTIRDNWVAPVKDALEDWTLEFGAKVEEVAKRNVSPGVGPGPHPHRTDHGWEWQDTGELEADISAEVSRGPERVSVFVGAWTVKHGFQLEVGWIGPSGQFYVYPWLMPAYEEARRGVGGMFPLLSKVRI